MPCYRPYSYHTFSISYVSSESIPSGHNGIKVYVTAPLGVARTADACAAGSLHGKQGESCCCYSYT